MRWLAMLCLVLGASAASTADELGRLLLSPEQRQALARQGQAGTQPRPGLPQDAVWTFNGEVRRSHGPGRRWINGRSDDWPGQLPLPVGDTWVAAEEAPQGLLRGGRILIHRESGR